MPEILQPAGLACGIALLSLVLILAQDSNVLQRLSKRLEGVLVLILGMLFLIGSLAADVIGIGSTPGFGRQQTIGVLTGIAITVYGLHFLRRHRKTRDNTFRGGNGLRS